MNQITFYSQATIPSRSTFWDVRRSMDEGVFFLPRLLDDSFPGASSGRLCMVPPNSDQACLGPGPLSLELLFEGRGHRCWIFSASPFDCSIQLSSACTWPSSARLDLLLRPRGPSFVLAGRCCLTRRKTLSWGWWALLRPGWLLLCRRSGWTVSPLWVFTSLSYTPIVHLVILQAMLPLPPLIGTW